MKKKIICILFGMAALCSISFNTSSKGGDNKILLKSYNVSLGNNTADNSMEDCFDDAEVVYIADKDEISDIAENEKSDYQTTTQTDSKLSISASYANANYNTDYGYKDLKNRSHGAKRQELYTDMKGITEEFYTYDMDVEKFEVEINSEKKEIYGIWWFEFSEYGLTQIEAVQTYYMLRNDNPYYYFLSNEVLATDEYICIVTDKEYSTYALRKNYYDKIEKSIASYKKLTSNYSTDYEKTLIVHDQIIMSVDYAQDTSQKSSSHNIVGVFDDSIGMAVCEGYAKACQLLLNYFDVGNIYVTGTASGEEHAWNIVQMDNNLWYGIDTTWDDKPDIKGGIDYTFFNCKSSAFTSEHKASASYRDDEYFLYDLPALADNTNYTFNTMSSNKTGQLDIEGMQYEYTGIYATLVGYTGKYQRVVIPRVAGNKIVRIIGQKAFSDNDSINEVIIPDTVNIIDNAQKFGDGAFAKCDKLAKVECSDSINYIGNWAFYICPKLVEINAPKRLKTVYYNAFIEKSSISNTFFNQAVKNDTLIKADRDFEECTSVIYMTKTGKAKQSSASSYESSNKNIATIAADGTITPKQEGKVLIIAYIRGGEYAVSKLSVERNDIKAYTVKNIVNSIAYTGSKVEQTNMSVYKDDGTLLKKGTDYTISYYNNKNVGTAKINITGIGSYKGTITKIFYITKKSMGSVRVSGVVNKTYTGSKLTQNIILYNGANKLVQNTDYTVAYTNNIAVGKATVTITGKNNYNGKIVKYFEIRPSKVSGIKVKSSGQTYIELQWNKMQGVSGYVVERYNTTTKKYVAVKKLSTNIYKDTKLQQSSVYIYRIKAYKGTYNGAYSQAFKTAARPSTPSRVTVSALGNKSIKISFKKNSKVSGYEIYRATSKNGKYTLLKTLSVNTTSFKNMKLARGKYYYYKVRAYKTVNNKKIYGSFSTVKYVKCK